MRGRRSAQGRRLPKNTSRHGNLGSCRSGGIGIRSGLKLRGPQGHQGSNPCSGTTIPTRICPVQLARSEVCVRRPFRSGAGGTARAGGNGAGRGSEGLHRARRCLHLVVAGKEDWAGRADSVGVAGLCRLGAMPPCQAFTCTPAMSRALRTFPTWLEGRQSPPIRARSMLRASGSCNSQDPGRTGAQCHAPPRRPARGSGAAAPL